MFFPRLRAQVKWVYILLVFVFGAGFVFLGVGSGSSIGDLLRGNFSFGHHSSGGSITKAQEDVAKHPRDAEPYRKLADALERKGRVPETIDALTQYTALEPKDANELEHLGRLELGQATQDLSAAQAAFAQQQETTAGSTFGAPPTSTFGRAVGQDPLTQAVSTRIAAQVQEATAKYQSSSGRAIATFTRLARLRPRDQSTIFALAQAAQTLRDTKTAVLAYKKLLKLTSDPTTMARIEAAIKALQQQALPTSAPQPGG